MKKVNSVPATEKAKWNRRRTAAIWLGVLAVLPLLLTFFLEGMEGLRLWLAVPFFGGIAFAIYATYFQPLVKVLEQGDEGVTVNTQFFRGTGILYLLTANELASHKALRKEPEFAHYSSRRLLGKHESENACMSQLSVRILPWPREAEAMEEEYYLCFLQQFPDGVYGTLRVIEKLS